MMIYNVSLNFLNSVSTQITWLQTKVDRYLPSSLSPTARTIIQLALLMFASCILGGSVGTLAAFCSRFWDKYKISRNSSEKFRKANDIMTQRLQELEKLEKSQLERLTNFSNTQIDSLRPNPTTDASIGCHVTPDKAEQGSSCIPESRDVDTSCPRPKTQDKQTDCKPRTTDVQTSPQPKRDVFSPPPVVTPSSPSPLRIIRRGQMNQATEADPISTEGITTQTEAMQLKGTTTQTEEMYFDGSSQPITILKKNMWGLLHNPDETTLVGRFNKNGLHQQGVELHPVNGDDGQMNGYRVICGKKVTTAMGQLFTGSTIEFDTVTSELALHQWKGDSHDTPFSSMTVSLDPSRKNYVCQIFANKNPLQQITIPIGCGKVKANPLT